MTPLDYSYYYYCPYCGKNQFLPPDGKCNNCGKEMDLIKSKFLRSYYREKAYDIKKQTSKKIDVQDLIREEASHNPLFDPTSVIKEIILPEPDPESAKQARLYFERKRQEEAKANVPKCPTCQSTNISKISTTSKVAGAAMFGLFSKTARSQFKCNNCGYKW